MKFVDPSVMEMHAAYEVLPIISSFCHADMYIPTHSCTQASIPMHMYACKYTMSCYTQHKCTVYQLRIIFQKPSDWQRIRLPCKASIPRK